MSTISLETIGSAVDAVVIGASAGGIEALGVLLPALPAASRVPVFVVLHLPRARRSLLVEIFTPRCAVALTEAVDKEPVVPGTVYFAPPDYHLLIDTGPQIALSVDELVNYSRPSIDMLFDSAADVYGDRLMGIVLTGGNDDGADGLAAIARAGGTTAVQDPASSAVPYMPAAALSRVPNAAVLTLAQLAELLAHVDRAGDRR